ncbi:hypothetical protein D3C85_1857690 [compost metagenome]
MDMWLAISTLIPMATAATVTMATQATDRKRQSLRNTLPKVSGMARPGVIMLGALSQEPSSSIAMMRSLLRS